MNRPFLPTISLGWWALGLGLAAVIWGLLVPVAAAAIVLFLGGPLGLLPAGFASAALEWVLAVTAIVVGMVALRRGERSWLALLALAGAVLVGGFWILFAFGHLIAPD